MTELTTYLKKLNFDPKLKNSFFAKYVQNIRLVILLVLLVFVIGFNSYSALPRVLNPQVKIPIVIVSTILPGASPKDVESLVTIPVEDGVSSLQKVKSVTSSSRDSASIITMEFESGVDPDKAKSDVQSAVDSISDLPENAEDPKVQKLDFENEPVWTFTLSSKNDYLSLTRFGKTLRDKLKDLPSVDRVETTGLDNEEVQILVKPEKIAAYGINPMTLAQTIKAVTGSFPAGGLRTDNSSFVLTVDPTVTKVEDLRNIRISANKQTVLLSDIADVQQRNKPDVAGSYIASKNQDPVQTVRFDVYKTSTANITKAIEDSQKVTKEATAPYDGQFTISSVLNTGDEITKQSNDLVRDLLITVSLVFLALFLFLGIRQAIIASFSIPLTFLITFMVMNFTGISLSFIAFFSFLLSLGLLVDDTIVIISAVTAYYRAGKFTPLEAGLLVWRDFRTAILTTTLTTVWAFVPLLLATGIIGEFIKTIPIVVSSTLLGSFIVAVFITLPLLIVFLKPELPHRVVLLFRGLGFLAIFGIFMAVAPQGSLFIPALLLFVLNIFVYFQVKGFLFKTLKARFTKPESQKALTKKSQGEKKGWSYYLNHGVINFEVVEVKYRNIIDKILSTSINRRKTVIAVTIFSLFSYILLPLGFVRNEFFPPGDQPYLYLSVELPSGTNLKNTNTEAVKILKEVREIPEVKFATATLRLGIDPGRGYSTAEDNNALITLVLPPESERSRSSLDIAEELRHKYASYGKGKVSVVEVSGGPPAGADLQINLLGDDLTKLDGYATKLQDYLKKQSGVTNVSKSIKSGTSKVVFVPDYEKMLAAGITQDQLGLWLRTYASGFTLQKDAKLTIGSNESQDIVFRTDSAPQKISEVSSLAIPTEKGPVSLISLGKFELRPNPTLITREDGKRTISVTAAVTKGVSSVEKNKDLEAYAKSLNLTDGYSWKTGGVNEENQSSVTSILQAMILSFFLIIVTMVLQFSSFRKALIVMLVIPLSISGVFIVFSLTNTPLSFPALIGVLALFGIVVKNSILIVDKINQNLKHNMPFKEAIVDASESRLEPITLTSIATIMGLIPITLSDPFWRGLGGAIISGLVFSGSMMLFFIPVVYYLIFQNSEGKKNK